MASDRFVFFVDFFNRRTLPSGWGTSKAAMKYLEPGRLMRVAMMGKSRLFGWEQKRERLYWFLMIFFVPTFKENTQLSDFQMSGKKSAVRIRYAPLI
jgi:hypothetical protein